MAVTELLWAGVNLMLLGMGIVFLFLAILVLVMNSMSWLVQRIAVAEPAVESISAISSATTESDNSNELVAVVTAAMNRYRTKQ